MVVGVVSTVFVGWLGKEALSAVGLVNTLTNFILVLFVALSTGCTVLVARLIGEGEKDKAREAVKQSVVIGMAVSLVVSVLCYIFAKSIISLFFGKADPEVVDTAVAYFKITLYTFPLALVNIMVSGTLRGAGDTRTPMGIAYIVNIVNVALNYVLIFGMNLLFFKTAGYGVTGSAWAVAISRGLGGLLSIGALYLPNNIIRVNIFSQFNIDPDLVKRMFKVGIPAALEQVVMQGGFLILQVVIAGMGTVAIAVYQIGMSINSICFIPVWGFGIAATTLIGQGLGARKPLVAEKCGWTTLKIAMVVSALLTAVIFIFAGQLVSIYSQDPEVIRIGTAAIRIFSLSQPFLAVVVVVSGGLRGAGDIMYVMVTSFVGIWVFRIALSMLINYLFHLGIMSVWIALCFDFLARSVMYFIRFQRGRWKEIVV